MRDFLKEKISDRGGCLPRRWLQNLKMKVSPISHVSVKIDNHSALSLLGRVRRRIVLLHLRQERGGEDCCFDHHCPPCRGADDPATYQRPSATSLVPRCVIATLTATIRAPVDHPTIAYVSGTAREKSGRTICDFFSKNRKRFCGTRKAKGVFSRPHHGACFFGMIHRCADG
jgi:hypothetical protein